MRDRIVMSLLVAGLWGCTGGSLENQKKIVPSGAGGEGGEAGREVAMVPDAQPADTMKLDPLHAAARCTSQSYWVRGENAAMAPGQACISCHQRSGEGPLYTIAGTLYPTGHEPDNCNGISSETSRAKVIVTGAHGAVLTLTANAAGNFYSIEPVAMPYQVKVVDGDGIERSMFATATDGDCNRCHTQNGSNAAPGRVTLP